MGQTVEVLDTEVRIDSAVFSFAGVVAKGTFTLKTPLPPDPPADPRLSDWTISPSGGSTSTVFTWRVHYSGPPSPAVYLVLRQPGTPAGQEPRLWVPMASDAGAIYSVTRTLSEGTWAWQIEAQAGGATVLSPGQAGPVVTQGQPEPPTQRMGPLVVCVADPRYFANPQGERVYLAGSHTWDNVQDHVQAGGQPFDYAAYLAWLKGCGHNFTRLWRWELPWWNQDGKTWTVTPQPWRRTGPGLAADGGLKFDLAQRDDTYFARLRQRVRDAQAAGIYVSVMLFEGWEVGQRPWWTMHPWHPDNNVNSLGARAETAYTEANAALLALQRQYVARCVHELNDCDNLLWEVCNEAYAQSVPWQHGMVSYVKALEAALPNQHPVGLTTAIGPGDDALYNSPADWVSPGPEAGWATDTPPKCDGRKVVLIDTDHLWGIGGTVEWVWKCFRAGANVLFMDPYLGNILPPYAEQEAIRQALGATRAVPLPPR